MWLWWFPSSISWLVFNGHSTLIISDVNKRTNLVLWSIYSVVVITFNIIFNSLKIKNQQLKTFINISGHQLLFGDSFNVFIFLISTLVFSSCILVQLSWILWHSFGFNTNRKSIRSSIDSWYFLIYVWSLVNLTCTFIYSTSKLHSFRFASWMDSNYSLDRALFIMLGRVSLPPIC